MLWLYQNGNYELSILVESDLLICVRGVVRIAMPATQESVIFDAGKNLVMY
jgi:hypothetical protein